MFKFSNTIFAQPLLPEIAWLLKCSVLAGTFVWKQNDKSNMQKSDLEDDHDEKSSCHASIIVVPLFCVTDC